ncbi:MAG: DUF58 domain-containing protein [Halobacteriaceae archaeon]
MTDAGRSDRGDGGVGAGAPGATTIQTLPGLGVVTVLAVLGGLGFESPGLLFAAALGVAYAAAARATAPPSPGGGSDGAGDSEGDAGTSAPVVVRRSFDDGSPAPGDEVEVTVAVGNRGSAFLPQVRVVDALPDGAALVEGAPRHATALRPGEVSRFTYAVTLERGEHEWGDPTVTTANHLGGRERTAAVAADASSLRAVPEEPPQHLPVRALGSLFAGRIETDEGGQGLEFHATREYRRGDPRRRVDWRHLAKTGDLATLEFRQERQATAVLVVDARPEAHRSPGDDPRSAVEFELRAARAVFEGLLDAGNLVGINVLAREDVWLPPATGRAHRARGSELLATHDVVTAAPDGDALFASFRPDRSEELKRRRIDRLDGRLPGSGEVLVFSPCCDDYICRVARQLVGRGHAVTVVSPDPTLRDTPGHRFAATRRAFRLRDLRRHGVRVLDWPPDEPLAVAAERAERRWSR